MGIYSTCKQIVTEKNIVEDVLKTPFFNDEPQLYTYSAILKDKDIPPDISGGGTSMNKNVAYIKAVMEAIERYSLIPSTMESKSWVEKSVKEIEKENRIDLNDFVKFSKEQLESSKFRRFRALSKKDKLTCCQVYDTLSNRRSYLPCQFFYLPYLAQENIIRLPISTGAASGFSKESCIYKGILEIIERDQFITSYLGQIPAKKIVMKNIPRQISTILNEFLFYKLKPHLLLLYSDIDIPTVLTILEDSTGIGPLYTLGLKCSPDISYCIRASLEEAFHSRRWLRYTMENIEKNNVKKLIKNHKSITEIKDRGLVWSSKKVRGKLNFWIKNDDLINIDLSKKSKELTLPDLLDLLKTKHWNCYTKNFSIKKLSKYNIYCYKVFIPQAHPLYLDERYPYLDDKRIKEIVPNGNKKILNDFLQPFL